MASVAHEVEALLDGMISFYAQRLRQVDVQKYFLLGKELGKGGYGRVLMANDRKTGQ